MVRLIKSFHEGHDLIGIGSRNTAIKIKIDTFVLLVITILLLGAMVLMVLRLLDQSESHVKTVKDMKVEFVKTQFQPGTNETTDEIERELNSDPEKKVGNFRNRDLNERSFQLIGKMKNLITLQLCDSVFNQKNLRHLEGMALQEVDLSGTDITDEAIKHIGKIQNLRSLKLADTGCSGACLIYLKDKKNLHVLEINGLVVRDEDLKNLEGCPLQWLIAGGTKITDAGCESLAKITTLEKLDISRTNVTGVGLQRLKSLPVLAELQVKDCNLKDADMATLAQFPKLQQLHLNRCEITDSGLMALGKSKSLAAVMLVNCPNITKEGASKFSQTFKRIGLGVNTEKSDFSKYKDFIPD